MIERLVSRDRWLTAFGIGAITALGWVYLVRSAGAMEAMAAESRMHAAMGMSDMRDWGLADWSGLFVMWAVMMTAMMLPSAAPVIMLVLGMYRRRGDVAARIAAAAFGAGYLIAWTGFSLVASALQVVLHRLAVLDPDMRVGSAALAGVVLVLAGLYQWLPLKNSCLTQCQSPLGFLSRYWREGTSGGFVLGLRHGLFCVGCCWALMALLFVVGVMNLFWVAALAVFVLVEKLTRAGATAGRVAGLGIAAWGLYLLTFS